MSKPNELLQQVPEVLKVAAGNLRAMSTQVVKLARENEAQSLLIQHMKIARRMEEREMRTDLDHNDKVAYLATIPAERLATFEQALEMSAGGDFGLGSVEEKRASESDPDSPYAGLDEYVLSGQALSGN